ncbi:MAG: YgfZ/GcvT domain-containing protein [Solirubrobacteraceae bacterium]|jgi:tRNA-modifying protein YgfZ
MATAETLTAEDRILTTACGLLDRSDRGKLALTGPEAKQFLNGQVTNDVEALEPGRGCYAAFLTHKGKMRGDLRVLDLGDELWLDTERVTLQELFNMIRRFKVGYDVEVHKRTLERALLSLIGPRSRAVADAASLGRDEHDNAAGEVAGVPVRLVATDVGVDVICDAERGEEVRAGLAARGAAAVSEEAAECLRVESGRPRWGLELDQATIPEEAGLNQRAVSFTKGCYVGQETVARLFYKGKPNRHLRGLRLSGPAEPGGGLGLGGRDVGRLGSVAVSPRHGAIGLAIVRREAQPGDRLAVGDGAVTAEVVALPFG